MKKRAVLVLCVLLINSAYAFSQNIKSALSGRVIDAQGHVVIAAEIVITDTRRGIERRLTSNDQGSFYQPGLEPGAYRITAAKSGFDDYLIEEVELRLGETANLEIKLQLPQVREQVTVIADALILLTVNDTKQSRSFSRDEMNDLPVQAGGQGRNFYAQARTAPGVTISTQAHQPFAVSGNRPRSNNYLVDSVDTTDANTGLIAGRGVTEQLVSQEAVASLEILTHNFKAEYGRNSGGIVSLVSKSGTNTPEGNNNNRPLDIAGALVRDPSSVTPIAFAEGVTRFDLTPAAGEYGTVGRNTERGDSFLDFNLSVSKDFVITERVRLQVRGEIFNVFNVTNFSAVDGVMSSPNFGRAVSAFDPRRAQLAARIVF